MLQFKSPNVLDILRDCADHPSAFLATNQDTQQFISKNIPGMVAYRSAGKHLVIAAGLSAKAQNKEALLEEFIEWGRQQKKKIIAIQMLRDDAEVLAKHGFTVNQIGTSYSLALDKFKISGSRFMKLRNKISRARRAGVEVKELGKDFVFSPILESQLQQIDQQWLRKKHAKELDFLIGEVGDLTNIDPSVKRLFVAFNNDEPVAYILYTACFGVHEGWMHDLTRKLPDAPTGVMELINLTAIETFIEEKNQYINFGFTPLTGLNPEVEILGAYSPLAQKIFVFLAKHGSFIYPATSQLQYKLKWAPNHILPEYIAFQGGFSLWGLWDFLKLTQAL